MAKWGLLRMVLFMVFIGIALQVQSVQIEQSIPESMQWIDESLGVSFNKTKLLWPMPTRVSMNESGQQLLIDPCTIHYKIDALPSDYVKQILNVYLIDVFQCGSIKPGNITLQIIVRNVNQMVAESTLHERYQITIRQTDRWELFADYYVGFLRGLETFSQLFEKKNGKYAINYRPILIDDGPQHVWRGLMIDTTRHFIPIQALKHQIDGLLYNKMSILHWQLVEDDSFPMIINSRPELFQYGKLSGNYSTQQIKLIITYAKIRGIRVVPEFSTPSHTQSWGRSYRYSNIVVNCSNGLEGQFDPTIELTYQVLDDVMREVNSTFSQSYVHFGGQKVSQPCYDQKKQIKQWMDEHQISNYTQLEDYYRKKQRVMWRSISPFKKVIYWQNQSSNVPIPQQDTIQWYGNSKSLQKLLIKNEVILSPYDKTFLDFGYDEFNEKRQNRWINWTEMYQLVPNITNVSVIGGEACLRTTVSNKDVLDQQIWMRASVINERLWNKNINIVKEYQNIGERLVAQARRMKARGFKVSPVLVGLCEKNITNCLSMF